MKQIQLDIPDSLLNEAQRLAEQNGISLNQLVTTALAEKISALLTVEHLRERGKRGSREKYEAVLAKVRDFPPAPEDALPERS